MATTINRSKEEVLNKLKDVIKNDLKKDIYIDCNKLYDIKSLSANYIDEANDTYVMVADFFDKQDRLLICIKGSYVTMHDIHDTETNLIISNVIKKHEDYISDIIFNGIFYFDFEIVANKNNIFDDNHNIIKYASDDITKFRININIEDMNETELEAGISELIERVTPILTQLLFKYRFSDYINLVDSNLKEIIGPAELYDYFKNLIKSFSCNDEMQVRSELLRGSYVGWDKLTFYNTIDRVRDTFGEIERVFKFDNDISCDMCYHSEINIVDNFIFDAPITICSKLYYDFMMKMKQRKERVTKSILEDCDVSDDVNRLIQESTTQLHLRVKEIDIKSSEASCLRFKNIEITNVRNKNILILYKEHTNTDGIFTSIRRGYFDIRDNQFILETIINEKTYIVEQKESPNIGYVIKNAKAITNPKDYII